MTRVAVFVDYQNCYMSARNVFGWARSHFTYGQIDPILLGQKLVTKSLKVDETRHLHKVNVFRGEPSSRRDPLAHGAMRRQIRAWVGSSLVEPVVRPLKYSRVDQPTDRGRLYRSEEKGIDVLLALSMAMGARNDEYDVAVLFTSDSDLVPAAEAVLDLGKRCEVAAWGSPASSSRQLRIPNRNVWCHWLDEGDYADVCDPTDYTRR